MNKRKEYPDFEIRMLSVEQCCAYIGLGKTTVRNLMKEIGAEIRIGRRCLYDRKVIDSYLESFTGATVAQH